MKKRIKIGFLEIVVLSLFLGSCSSYRIIDIDVLKPARQNLGQENIKILLLDRKLVHQSDEKSADELYRSLGITRNDLINCFYEGFQNGVNTSFKKVALGRAIGLETTEINDTVIPVSLSPSEIEAINKGLYTHILAVEYCLFRWTPPYRNRTDNSLFVRLYDAATYQPIDSVESNLFRNDVDQMALADQMCDFYYRQGLNFARHIVPTWKMENRRIYMNNNTLKLGYFYMKNEDYEQAYKIWNAALNKRPLTAIKASINLAWLKEREGNFQGAINTLEAALKHMKKNRVNNGDLFRYINNYIPILKGRIEDDKKLSNQL